MTAQGAATLGGRSWRRDERFVALLLLAPSVLYLFVMAIYPTIYSLWLAFENYTLYRPDMVSFAGLENFQLVWSDEVFWQSLKVTVIFALAAVAIELVLGLAVAILLDREMLGIGVLRTLLIVPVLISPVGMGLTWRYILAPSYGLLNYFLQKAGLPPVDWIVSTTWSLPMVILVDVWQWTPFVTLILLSAIQGVSVEVVEAASLDGLTEWQKLRRIIIPLIYPVMMVVVLIRLIDAIRTFDLIFVLTRGGPGSSTEILSIYSYVTGFTAGDMGSAAAIAWITVILINLLVILFLRTLAKAEG